MWNWAFWIAAAPLTVSVAAYGVGAMLPVRHSVEAEQVLPARPNDIAALIRDVEAQPQWRSGVKSINVVERQDRSARYVEVSRHGKILFELAETIPNEQFRSVIADPDLPFGGSWTISLAPAREGTLVRIEEQGEVKSPMFRFFAAVSGGHEQTISTYLTELRAALAIASPRANPISPPVRH